MTSLAGAPARELGADTHAALAALDPAARAVLLHFDCNSGVGAAQRAFMRERLGPDFSAPLRARAERWDGPPLRPTADELDAALREEQTAFARGVPSRRPRSPALWIAPGAQAEWAGLLCADGELRVPALPWSTRANAALPARSCVSASFRTMSAVGDDGRVCCELKLDSRPDERPGHDATWSRRLESWKRRLVMSGLFGVDTSYDGAAIDVVDALHSLALSDRLAAIAAAPGAPFALLRETGAAVASDGSACIVREAAPYPAAPGDPLLIPCHALVGNPRERRVDLLRALSRSSGREPAEIALDVGRAYLRAWHALMFRHRIVLLMPHAQNALFELRAGNAIGRIVLKDMRDAESWDAYRRWTGNHTRLVQVDRHYVRYEMTVHPLHYDAQRWPDRESATAAGLFSYSFEMLRNYVLRGFELALTAFDPAQGRRASAGFADAVAELAGVSGGPAGDALRIRSAARVLRRRWVELALS